jgi:hypothetical protein
MLKVDTMLSLDLIESLQSLNRADKLYAMQVLVSNLAQEETNFLKPGLAYEVSSPYDSFDAAKTTPFPVKEQRK